MNKIKSSLSVARTTYTNWLFSSRIIIMGFVFMFMYSYVIDPMLKYSDYYNTPLNVLEPFTAIVNNKYSLPLVIFGFLVMIADFPRLDDFSTFLIFRTGRFVWAFGQIIFLIFSGMTYILFILFSSMICVASKSFILNAWSLAARYAADTDDIIVLMYPFARIDLSVLNQVRPYSAVIHGVLLVLMFILAVGLVQMLFAVMQKKVISVFLNLLMCALGLVLIVADVNLKWIFPISNAVYGWHYDDYLNETNVPITFSYVYFIVFDVIIGIILINIVKRCSFHITGGTE